MEQLLTCRMTRHKRLKETETGMPQYETNDTYLLLGMKREGRSEKKEENGAEGNNILHGGVDEGEM